VIIIIKYCIINNYEIMLSELDQPSYRYLDKGTGKKIDQKAIQPRKTIKY